MYMHILILLVLYALLMVYQGLASSPLFKLVINNCGMHEPGVLELMSMYHRVLTLLFTHACQKI